MAASDALSTLNRSFRTRYLDYAELTAQLESWSRAFPDIVRLSSIGRSSEGRELWLLTLGPDPDSVRPAVWVDGNMHASELCGSNAALAIAEDVIRLHTADAAALHALPAPVIDLLRRVQFHVLPRMSPDGAEAVLKTGRFVRSVIRNERRDRNRPRWVARDVDGDGLALVMRKPDPTGEFVESTEVPGLMVLREIEDAGPSYKLYPEGVIENFDGVTVPTPTFLSDNPTDLNRNFPFSWMPEYAQEGAGEFPLSEPESRAVVEFTSRLPNLFAWINFHTFGGVFIRPLGHQPDTEMDPADLAVFRQIGVWGERYADYPMVGGFEEFTYQPDRPLHGDLADYAYHQRGCITYVCELWDLFRQAGLARKKRFVDYYTQLSREDVAKIGRWDDTQNQRRSLPPWRPFAHPQLGAVEIGGLDPRFGIWNPPPERIASICDAQSGIALRVAAMTPVIVMTVEARAVDAQTTRVEVSVANHGYLPTYVLSSARKLEWNEPLYAEIETDGCVLDHPPQARREIGHLDGWGRGLYELSAAPYFQRSRGSTGVRRFSWVVRGRGTVRVRAGACRVGWVSRTVGVP